MVYRLISFVLLLLVCRAGSAQVISTVAGTGDHGYYGEGVMATDAWLDFPCKVTTDRAGYLYISDFWTGRIRRVDLVTGIIHTIAGNGTDTHTGDGGQATAAGINSPRDVVEDGAGNLYIAEDSLTDARTRHYQHAGSYIRKVTAAGVISTIAGNGSVDYSGDGGPAINAGFREITSLAVDRLGNLYVGDAAARVRKIDTAGIITTFAGTGTFGLSADGGPATAANIFFPQSIVVDSNLNVYFTDGGRVRKVDAAGIITTIAGTDSFGYSGDGGPATAAQMGSTFGLARDKAGNFFVSDCLHNVIRKIDAAGIITTVGGNGTRGNSGDGGHPDSAQISSVYGLAVDSTGNIYLSDIGNDNVRKICPACKPAGAPVISQQKQQLQLWPQPGHGQFTLLLSSPVRAVVRIVITDALGQRVRELSCAANQEANIQLDVPPGIYFVAAVAGDATSMGKVVVE